MMRKIGLLSALLVFSALLACKRATQPTNYPGAPSTNGYERIGPNLYTVKCSNGVGPCYAEASKACPKGFNIVDGTESTQVNNTGQSTGSAHAFGNSAFASGRSSSSSTSVSTREMVFGCQLSSPSALPVPQPWPTTDAGSPVDAGYDVFLEDGPEG